MVAPVALVAQNCKVLERYPHFHSCINNVDMKFSSLAIFLVVFSSTEGNGYLGRVHDLSRKVVANLHSGIKELGNVATIVAGDLTDGFKTVSKVFTYNLLRMPGMP